VMQSALHGVVDFLGYGLLRRLWKILVHLSFRVKENGAIFGAVFGFTAMVHVVWWVECVWASAVTSAMIWCSASLATLHESLVGGSRISFLWRCSKVFLPIF
jgi:hypothetical protein